MCRRSIPARSAVLRPCRQARCGHGSLSGVLCWCFVRESALHRPPLTSFLKENAALPPGLRTLSASLSIAWKSATQQAPKLERYASTLESSSGNCIEFALIICNTKRVQPIRRTVITSWYSSQSSIRSNLRNMGGRECLDSLFTQNVHFRTKITADIFYGRM